MYSIGEFSSATGIPVRTLRFYHEEGLLVPANVDAETNYRSYDDRNLEAARVITALRGFDVSLDDIREILAGCTDDSDVLAHLEHHKASITTKLERYQNIVAQIDNLIRTQQIIREEDKMFAKSNEVQESDLEPMLVAGIRMTGRYIDCGQGFATLGKALGRHIAGKPLCLFYDGEYRDTDANFEPCMPIRTADIASADGVTIRELPGGRSVTLLHHGPYEKLSRSYARILHYAKSRGYNIQLPTREVYHKGPGMIFRGNPKKYITEIQLPIAS